jgi:uncharacterized membrane protein
MLDFDPHMVLLIVAAAVVTYLTRIGGYVLITRMTHIPPRMEAALNAVPAAVLTTLVAPTFFNGGIDIKIALVAAAFVGLYLPASAMLVAGWVVVMGWRYFIAG